MKGAVEARPQRSMAHPQFREVNCEVCCGAKAGAFFPNPGWACAGCEYRGACRVL